jgi:hypothetical protein
VKFTINGFSQEKLLEYGLDAQDALLLRWLVDFSSSPKIRTVQQEGFTYYWIKYDAVLEDLPILTIKTAKGIGKKFLIFAEKGILVKHTERTVSGSYSCFRFTDVIDEFMRSTSKVKSHCPEKGVAKDQEEQHCPEKGSHKALPQKGQSYNQSTINPSTNTTVLPPTPAKESDHDDAMKWVEFFVNKKGFQFHEAQTASTMIMYREWVKDGITVDDVELADIDVRASLGGGRPDTPKYYKNFVKKVILEKQKSLSDRQRSHSGSPQQRKGGSNYERKPRISPDAWRDTDF